MTDGTASAPGPAGDDLTRHFAWVRRLAASLVRDPGLADDVAQDALVLALERPPRESARIRAWLGTVVRNLVRQRHRARITEARILDDARSDANAPSAFEVVERAVTSRALMDAVLELPGAQRDALLLRFLENLPPRAIAARLGLPVSTVHTRIQRGLASLRERLDAAHDGDRRAWHGALTPLLPTLPIVLPTGGAAAASATTAPVSAAVVPALGWIAMKYVLATGLVAVIALSAWFVWPTADDPRPGSVAAEPSAEASPALEGEAGAVAPALGAASRREVSVEPAAAAGAPDPAPPAPAPWTVEGLVLDAAGRPLPGVGVARTGSDDVVTTAADGSFAMVDDGTGARELRLVEPGWSLALGARLAPTAERAAGRRPVLVASRSVVLAGTVQDPRGVPIADATLAWRLPEHFRSRFAMPLDDARLTEARARTDADGRFELDVVPAIDGATLTAGHVAWRDAELRAPAVDNRDLRIVLAAADPIDGALSGQVLDAEGRPAAGALIATLETTAKADPRGMFTIDRAGEPGREERLTAVLQGFQPATLERPDGGWPEFVTLQLGRTARSIRGVVVDVDDQPVAGARVWAVDPGVLGVVEGGLASVEGIVAGRMTSAQRRQRFEQLDSDAARRAFVRDEPDAMWAFVRTDTDGGFELPGLSDGRTYRLAAMDEGTLIHTTTEPLEAGAGAVRIVLPTESVWAELSGTVVTRSGRVVSGAEVQLMADAMRLEVEPGRAATRHWTGPDARAVTDAAGRFTLTRVPRTFVYLRIDGDDILPLEFGRGEENGLGELVGGRVGDLRIEVEGRVHVQVRLADPSLADEFGVVDADDRELPIQHFQDRGRWSGEWFAFDEQGRTPVVTVPESASRIVLRKGGEVVREAPLRLIVGETNTVEF